MFALVDCNNFYASCERVFNPQLEGKPIIVLSNNDGCIIARSNEAKAIGIPMAAPVYQYQYLIKGSNVQVFSANFPLYGDISSRVMHIISTFTPHVEIYSIDEAFLSLNDLNGQNFTEFAINIRETIKKSLGIPVSIGIAPTKTLAKIANEIIKTSSTYTGVFDLSNDNEVDTYLKDLSVGRVWGIGRKLVRFLQTNGIYTALQLKYADDKWIKKNLHTPGLQTVWELRGISCNLLQETPVSKKSIISSRSFGRTVETVDELKEAAASYVTRAAEKLREETLYASYVHVSITTNWHRQDHEQYHNSAGIALPQATSHTPTLIRGAYNALQTIYRPGYKYKKLTVMLTHLSEENNLQQNLFYSDASKYQENDVMKVVDKLNMKLGKETIRFAAQGLDRPWYMRSSKQSPHYTRVWKDILTVKA